MTLLPSLLLGSIVVLLVLAPLLSSRKGAPARGPSSNPTEDDRRRLRERKEKLVRSIAELDEDYGAGRLAETDYRALRDEYEVQAAAVLWELDKKKRGKRSGEKPAPSPASRWPTVAAWTGGVVVFVGVAAALLVGSVRPRGAGETMTGVSVAPIGGDPLLLGVPDDARLGALEARVAADSTDLEALLEVGHLYLQGQQLDAAGLVTLKALEVDQGALEAHAHVSMLAFASGDVDFALEVLNRLLDGAPGFAEGFLFRGMIQFATGASSGAVADWERYLAVAPPGTDTSGVVAMLGQARVRVN